MKDITIINKELRSLAIAKGLCEEWQNDWIRDKNKHELVSMFIKGIDFCIINEYPSISYIKQNFKDVIHDHCLFVDEDVSLKNERTIVLNGRCNANVIYDKYSVGQIYIRHNSKLLLLAKDNCRVFIMTHDKSSIKVQTQGNAKASIFEYGTGSIICNGLNINLKRGKME